MKEGIAIISSRFLQPVAGPRGGTSVHMPWHQRRPSLGTEDCIPGLKGPHALLCSPGNGSSQAADLRIRRQHSSDSVSSINSATSHSSVGSNIESDSKKKKRKNWVSARPGSPRAWLPAPPEEVSTDRGQAAS